MLATGLFLLIKNYLKNKKRLLNDKELMKSQFQQEMLKAQLEIQEETLKQISQEVHDNIGQTLSLAKLTLNTLGMLNQQSALDKIDSTKQLITKAIQDLRSLSKTLNKDAVLSLGLVRAVEAQLEFIERIGSFETHFEQQGLTNTLPPQAELICFRIVQEAVNNIIKHAEATKIEIVLHFKDYLLEMMIKDNGKGFNQQSEETSGTGLRNMKSRAVLIGGTLEVETNDKGTSIFVTVPTH